MVELPNLKIDLKSHQILNPVNYNINNKNNNVNHLQQQQQSSNVLNLNLNLNINNNIVNNIENPLLQQKRAISAKIENREKKDYNKIKKGKIKSIINLIFI